MWKKILVVLVLIIVLLVVLGIFFGEAAYKNDKFGFSFKYPTNLSVREEDVGDSYIEGAKLLLSINKVQDVWGTVYVVPDSYKGAGEYSHSEGVISGGEKLIVGDVEVKKDFYLTNDGSKISGIRAEIKLSKDTALKVVFFMPFQLTDDEHARSTKEGIFDKMLSSFKSLE